MKFMQRWGSGLVYALVSVVLVVGGLSLGLAEGSFSPSQPPPTQASITVPAPSATSVPPSAVPNSPVPNSPVPASPAAATATSAAPASATPQVVFVTATASKATATTYVLPRATSTYRPYATAIPCGPYRGWVRSYIVQAGDTLFHISTLYGTNVPALQTANCLTTTFIFPGEQLWVPNVPTVTPGLTMPPSYATTTAYPTLPLTLTPLPFTETPSPTPTETLNPNP